MFIACLMTKAINSFTSRKCHFLPGGGLPVLFLRSKRRIKRFFKLKGGITYIFLKTQNILLNIPDSRERDCQMQLGDKNSNGKSM